MKSHLCLRKTLRCSRSNLTIPFWLLRYPVNHPNETQRHLLIQLFCVLIKVSRRTQIGLKPTTKQQATQLLLLLLFISQSVRRRYLGCKTWFFSKVLFTYAGVATIDDDQLREALLKCEFRKASDPDDTNKNKPLVTLYKPPNDPQKTIPLENFRMYTFITIPYSKLSSSKEEHTWIESTLERVLCGMRRIIFGEGGRKKSLWICH